MAPTLDFEILTHLRTTHNAPHELYALQTMGTHVARTQWHDEDNSEDMNAPIGHLLALLYARPFNCSKLIYDDLTLTQRHGRRQPSVNVKNGETKQIKATQSEKGKNFEHMILKHTSQSTNQYHFPSKSLFQFRSCFVFRLSVVKATALMNLPMNFNIFPFNLTTISAYFAPVDLDILPTSFAAFVDDSLLVLAELCRTISQNLFCPIQFTELQTILLTIFLVILSINLALIGFYWSKYGGVITDRFIRASECVIERWIIAARNLNPYPFHSVCWLLRHEFIDFLSDFVSQALWRKLKSWNCRWRNWSCRTSTRQGSKSIVVAAERSLRWFVC